MGRRLGDVELLDDAAAPPDPRAPLRHRRRVRTLLVVVAAVVVGAGVLLVVQHRLDDAADARVARAQQVAGVVDELNGPPQVAWAPDEQTSSDLLSSAASADGIVVLGHPDAGGTTATLQGLDGSTGRVLWTSTVERGAATTDAAAAPVPENPAGTGDDGVVTCGWMRGAAQTPVACLVTWPDASAGPGADAASTLAVLDASGTVGRHVHLPAGVGAASTGAALVTAAATPDGAVTVEATDPVGAPLWSTTVPASADADASALTAHAGGLVLPARTGTAGQVAAVLDADGRLVTADGTPPGTTVTLTSRGRPALTRAEGLDPLTTVQDGDDRWAESGGLPATLTTDDGSEPDLEVLTTALVGGGLSVADAAGTVWSVDTAELDPIVLDGRVYSRAGTELTARDLRTGDERWHVTLPSSQVTTTTDGRDLLVLAGDGTVTAYALRDGAQRWTAHPGDGQVQVVADRLVLRDARGITVLG